MPDNEDVVLETLDENEGEKEPTGEGEAKKQELTPEQIQGIKKRQFTKLAKELGIELPKPESAEKKVEKKEEGFDYGQKAFLKASGVAQEDFDFVKEVMQSTGKSLDDVLESKYFKAELKERVDKRNSVEAVPSGTKRSGTSSRDTVEFWLAKGEMPPADQPELRRQYVNAKVKQDSGGSPFSSNPVV